MPRDKILLVINLNSSDSHSFYLDEKQFQPHGISRWIFDRQENTSNKLATKDFIAEMADSGINVLRTVVPGEFERGVEPELGKYNSDFLRPLDQVFQTCASFGIQVVLCLFDHASLYLPTDPDRWKHGIYNSRFNNPQDFFGSKELIKLEKGRIEFLIDHFSQFPNIFAWEPMNEMNYLGMAHGDKVHEVTMQWFDDMASYMHKIDGQHLVTGSLYGGEVWLELNSHPQNNFIQIHTYDEDYDPDRNVEIVKKYVAENKQFKKPVVISEFGSKRNNPKRYEFIRKTIKAAQGEQSSAWLYCDIWEKTNPWTFGDMDEQIFQIYKETRPMQ